LYESNYSLEDFKEVLQDVDRFQIQLVTNKDLHVEVKFLLIKPLSGEQSHLFASHKKKQIMSVLGYELKHLEVLAGIDLDLYTDQVTCKTPLIADLRK